MIHGKAGNPRFGHFTSTFGYQLATRLDKIKEKKTTHNMENPPEKINTIYQALRTAMIAVITTGSLDIVDGQRAKRVQNSHGPG